MPLEFEERRNRGKSKMLRELLVMSGGRRLFKDFILESVVEIGHLGKENQGRGHEPPIRSQVRNLLFSCCRSFIPAITRSFFPVVAPFFLQSHATCIRY
ncbi:unnamed protein product [Lactuca virosa]|uniref:Uncharacterized protein n=1 Tax=Lactuca virosa TaxID=75947 RepID=A0AAU9NYU8_9ASTR|nr:unnamed protein product [Lactuca virosa]